MVASNSLIFLKKHSILWFSGLAFLLSTCQQITNNQEDTTINSQNSPTSEDSVKEEPIIEDFNFRLEKIELILYGYIQKYDKREFMALQDYFSPNVEQFINLKNIPAKRVTEEAREYFSNKRDVRFIPNIRKELEGAQVEIEGNRCIVTFDLHIEWMTQTNPRDTLWEEMNSTVEIADKRSYSAIVNAAFVFDEQYKIRSYKELKIKRKKFKTHKDIQTFNENKTPLSIIPKDTWIEDGEFSLLTQTVVGWGTFGKTLVQVYHQNQSYWIDFDDFNKMEPEEQVY